MYDASVPDDAAGAAGDAMGFDIPDSELEWRFTPTGGPGGQHANKTSTRVELIFDLAGSRVFEDVMKARLVGKLGEEVRITEDRTRSQMLNRKRALRRLDGLLTAAAKPDPPKRKRSRPSKAVTARRVEAKRRRSETKSLRRPPSRDD